MPLKLNISDKGKAWKLEIPVEVLAGKSLGDKLNGKIIKPELGGYELEITGGSDFSGFPMFKNAEGIGLKKVLLTKGWGMWSKPKGLKKKKTRLTKGLRLRKTVRGKTISESSIQINLNVLKQGSTPLEKIFPEQNKPKEPKQKPAAQAEQKESPAETKAEQPKEEKATEKPKEETTKKPKEETKESDN
ncbi:MAG: hypothetical protein KJ600_06725 [Nanoarchaeota archaeon]|nr:hypothetical protein [Nanoarchaeota archaeon]MBU1104217.1 hypothetical protein [Nanoarchaeota archaeon]